MDPQFGAWRDVHTREGQSTPRAGAPADAGIVLSETAGSVRGTGWFGGLSCLIGNSLEWHMSSTTRTFPTKHGAARGLSAIHKSHEFLPTGPVVGEHIPTTAARI